MADALTANDIQTDTYTGKQAAQAVHGGAHDGSDLPLVGIMNPRDTTPILPAQDDTLVAGFGATRTGWAWTTNAVGLLGVLSMIWDALKGTLTAALGAQLAAISPTATQLTGGTGNSCGSPIAAGAIFMGSAESCLGYSEITAAFATDQPGTLTVQQSPDGTNWDIADTKAISAGPGDTFGVSVRAAFYRVLFQNTAGSAQTYFRLQVIKVPVGTRQPRTLTALGNLKVALQEALPAGTNVIGTALGKDAALTALGYAQQVMVAGTVYTLGQIATTGGLTAANALPVGATTVIITPENANVRIVLDGSTPTSSRGTVLQAGTPYSYTMADLTQIKLIMAIATVATLNVEFAR